MIKQDYSKEPKTFDAQVQLLKERGLTFPHEDKAIKVLKNISYNRLSAYWYPLLKEPKEAEIFKPNSSFETAFHFYQFDSELRMLTFYAIEQVEVALRTQLIYHQSHKYRSGFWFSEPTAFDNYAQYISNLNRICNGVKESKEAFIKKYSKRYNQFLPPAWKSFEIISFRLLYSIFKNLKNKKDKAVISKHFGVHHTVFISWMDTLVYIRNICAHHSRLWNIKLTISPTWMKSPRNYWVDRWENEIKNESTKDKQLKVYAVLCILAYLLDHINPYHRFKKDLKNLISKYTEIDIAHMGFTQNWLSQDLWK